MNSLGKMKIKTKIVLLAIGSMVLLGSFSLIFNVSNRLKQGRLEIEQVSLNTNEISEKIKDVLIKNLGELDLLTDLIFNLQSNIAGFKTE